MDAAAHVLAFLVGVWDWFWPICSTILVFVGGVWGVIKAWPSIRRAFQVSDTVAGLPELIGDLRKEVAAVKEQTQSLEEKSDRKEKKLEAIEAEIATMKATTASRLVDWQTWRDEQATIVNELTHNGGSSLKDQISRLDLAVHGYEQLPGETLEAAVKRMRTVLSQGTGPVTTYGDDTPE